MTTNKLEESDAALLQRTIYMSKTSIKKEERSGAFLFLEIIISHLPKGHGSYPNSAISFSANSIPIFSCASTVEAPV